MVNAPSTRTSFKEKMRQAREDAIVQTVNRLLAERGYEAMTVDAVAAEVGIAKASLYTHFPSKEDLAAAAMVRVLLQVSAHMDGLAPELPALARLRAVVAWAMHAKLAGQMPFLPSHNSALRATLMAHSDYLAALGAISARLTGWIVAAQVQGHLRTHLPPQVILYTLYARACDPVLDYLKLDGLYTDAQMVDLVLDTCFQGLGTSSETLI